MKRYEGDQLKHAVKALYLLEKQKPSLASDVQAAIKRKQRGVEVIAIEIDPSRSTKPGQVYRAMAIVDKYIRTKESGQGA